MFVIVTVIIVAFVFLLSLTNTYLLLIGAKGFKLDTQIREIYTRFYKEYAKFADIEYNPLDPEGDQFFEVTFEETRSFHVSINQLPHHVPLHQSKITQILFKATPTRF